MSENELFVHFAKALKDGFGKEANDFNLELKNIPDIGTVGFAYSRGKKECYLLCTPDLRDLYEPHDIQALRLLLLDVAKYLTVELKNFIIPNQSLPRLLDGACAYRFLSFIRF